MGVRIPHGPPKKHEILRLVLFLLSDGAISLVQFSAHLFPNLITPPIIDLRVNCKGSTGLCVSGFCGYCRHADIGIGQQNADEGMPEHMGMNFFNEPRTVPHHKPVAGYHPAGFGFAQHRQDRHPGQHPERKVRRVQPPA